MALFSATMEPNLTVKALNLTVKEVVPKVGSAVPKPNVNGPRLFGRMVGSLEFSIKIKMRVIEFSLRI